MRTKIDIKKLQIKKLFKGFYELKEFNDLFHTSFAMKSKLVHV